LCRGRITDRWPGVRLLEGCSPNGTPAVRQNAIPLGWSCRGRPLNGRRQACPASLGLSQRAVMFFYIRRLGGFRICVLEGRQSSARRDHSSASPRNVPCLDNNRFDMITSPKEIRMPRTKNHATGGPPGFGGCVLGPRDPALKRWVRPPQATLN